MRKLLFIIAVLLSFGVQAQTFTPIHNYQAPDGLELIKHLGIPYGDTATYIVTDSVRVGGIPRKSAVLFFQTSDSTLYIHYGKWIRFNGGSIITNSGVDSITYRNSQLCQWVDGVSTCYFLNKFYDSTALNHDSTKILYFNTGHLVDSVLIPVGTIHVIQDGAGETHIVRVEDSTRLHFPTLKNSDDITPSKNADSSISFNFTNPHYTKDQVDSIKATITADGITRAELIDTANNKVNISDTAAMLAPYHGGGVSQSVISDTLKNYTNSGSVTTDNVVYSTPIALSVANHLMTGSLALKSQSAYTLFGRGSGSGTPSFLSSIDSNWVSGLHSEAYYNTKYNLPSQSGNNGKYLTTDGTTPSWGRVSGWSTTGNAGTDGGTTNFIGTTDNNIIAIKVNSQLTAYFNTGGKFTLVNPGFGSGYISPGNEGEINIGTSTDAKGGGLNVGHINLSQAPSSTLTIESTTNNASLSLFGATNNYIKFTQRGVANRGTLGYAKNSTDFQIRVNGASDLSTGTQAIRVFGGTQDVHIGQSTTDIPTALFQVASTTQGTLITRMTKTQRNAIASPAPGLMVIVTGETGGEYLSWYNSSTSGWVKVTSTAD